MYTKSRPFSIQSGLFDAKVYNGGKSSVVQGTCLMAEANRGKLQLRERLKSL